MDELGNRIRALRRARGLTPMHVARAADVTREWLSRLERGHIPHPHPDALARVAEVLGVTTADLLGGRKMVSPAGGRSAGAAAPTAAMVEELAHELIDCGNLTLIEKHFFPTCMIHGLRPGRTTDRRGLSQAIAELRAAVPDLTIHLDDVIAAGEKIAVRWTLSARCAGREPVDAAIDVVPMSRGMAHFHLVDGQVAEAWIQTEAPAQALPVVQSALRNRLTPVFGYLQLLVQRPSALPRPDAVAVVEEEVLPRFRDALDVLDQMQELPIRPLSKTRS